MTPLRNAARALVFKESGTDSFDALSDGSQERVLVSAAATLLAVRKPSERMLRAAKTVEFPGGYVLNDLDITLIWERMLDVAASEK